MLIKLLLLAVLILIAYQDFKYREIHWALFLVIAVFFFIDGQTNMPFNKYLLNTLYNMIFVLLQFVFVYVFYLIRGHSFKSLFTNIIGVGDCLLISILTLAFSWHGFLLYYIGGLFFTLLIWLFVKNLKMANNKLIPFAGLLSIYCVLLVILEFFLPNYGRFGNESLKIFIYG